MKSVMSAFITILNMKNIFNIEAYFNIKLF